MNTSLFIVFFITSCTTVATPGPGVLMTIMKSMQFGFKGARYTILGTASGTVVMAVLSATGLSLILSTSPHAYSVLRIVGACYMIWLGIKNWRAKSIALKHAVKEKELIERSEGTADGPVIRPFHFFLEGIGLQMTNPMLIMFFVSLFPQFIDPKGSYLLQFTVLSLTYFMLVAVIHTGYSFIVTRFRELLSSERWTQWIYRTGGTIFFLLALSVLRGVWVQGW